MSVLFLKGDYDAPRSCCSASRALQIGQGTKMCTAVEAAQICVLRFAYHTHHRVVRGACGA